MLAFMCTRLCKCNETKSLGNDTMCGATVGPMSTEQWCSPSWQVDRALQTRLEIM